MYFTPSILKELCKQYGLVPSKKYGQNFLISDTPIKKMIEAADIRAGENVIEIGPGFGILTLALAEYGADVTAFEIERRLEEYWEEHRNEHIQIVWGNAIDRLKTEDLRLKTNPYKVIANLPYQITSHVLRTLLELEQKPQSITVMVQKEVADRIVAKPGDMSMLSVSVQYYGDVRIVCKVPRGNFWPIPDVDSAVITITLKHASTPFTGSSGTGALFDRRFFEVVKTGFANKRKQLWRNIADGLKLEKDVVQKAVMDITGNEKARAQELSVEQWISLTGKLT